MRNIKLAMLALVAVLAMAAVTAGSAFALPEFTKTGSFTGKNARGTTPTLKGTELGVEGTITCTESSSSGKITGPMEVKEVIVTYKGKCEETISGSKSTCTEPITTKDMKGTLGWIENKESGPVGQELEPESGSEFVETKCGGNNTKVEGKIVGEYPESSLNKSGKEFKLVFKATGTKEQYSTLLLLSGFDTGLTLKVSGFFGGEASQAQEEVLNTTETGEIKT